MKILNLEINNIRGIRHFEHDFQGENAIIVGDNGSGKSSILDAIDFLLTGNMSRLKGDGTSGISVSRHGIHVDSSGDLSLGKVKALVKIKENAKPFWIERYIKEAEQLCCPHEAMKNLSKISSKISLLAAQGQHMLTRRQMLRFISVAPKERAKQIEVLLNLESVGNVRTNLVSVKNILKKKKDDANTARESTESDVASVFGLELFDNAALLQSINANRTTLGLSPLEDFSAGEVDKGVDRKSSNQEQPLSPSLLKDQIENVIRHVSNANLERIQETDSQLRNSLEQLRGNPNLLRALPQLELLRLGLKLVDSNACPLCDVTWEKDELSIHIQAKIVTASEANELLNQVENLEEELRNSINILLSGLQHLTSSPYLTSNGQIGVLTHWKERLTELRNELQDSKQNYPSDGQTVENVAILFTTDQLRTTLNDVKDYLALVDQHTTAASEEGTAAERLSQAKILLARLKERQLAYVRLEGDFEKSVLLLNIFDTARVQILEDLYESISEDFAHLYKQLHVDEKSFKAQLLPRGPGTHFNVGFCDRGMFPPNAIHSDGHQDSMGICLFLVLNKRLSNDDLQIMLLDDVVTSVDIGHRKELAKLVADGFKHRQIIVTTHDRTWVRQLKALEFALKSNTLEIASWDIQSGPCFLKYRDDWDKIEKDLIANDVGAASARLRQWAEAFFRQVCHNFQVPVTFKIDGRWTLDDLISPTCGVFKSELKKAKNFASISGNNSLFATIQKVDNRRSQIFTQLGIEGWAVNAAVHHNEWANLSSDEFKDVVDVFRDFYDLLHCEKCNRLLRVSDGKELIMCDCPNVRWPLP